MKTMKQREDRFFLSLFLFILMWVVFIFIWAHNAETDGVALLENVAHHIEKEALHAK